MPNIQDVGNTNTNPFSLFSCLFPGIFGPFAQPIVTYIGWVFFLIRSTLKTILAEWDGISKKINGIHCKKSWRVDVLPCEIHQSKMANHCGEMCKSGNRRRCGWETPQSKKLIMKYHHLNLGQTWYSTRIPIRKYGRVSEENMKKHLLGWGPGYYNLYVYLYIPWNHSYLQYFQSANLDQTARSVVVSTFHIFVLRNVQCSTQTPKIQHKNLYKSRIPILVNINIVSSTTPTFTWSPYKTKRIFLSFSPFPSPPSQLRNFCFSQTQPRGVFGNVNLSWP